MPALDVSLGGGVVDLLNPLLAPKDLSTFGQDIHMAVTGFDQFLDTPLFQLDPPHNGALISYKSATASWQPAGGPVGFTLGGGFSASIRIVHQGSLFKDDSFNDIHLLDGFISPEPIDGFTVPAGVAYVVTRLGLSISGGLSASAQAGEIGISTSASGSENSYAIHYKALPASTLLRDAIPVALAQFVLPMHPDTVANLSDNDVLAYDFDGTLSVGFGAHYGIQGSLGSFAYSLPASASLTKYVPGAGTVKPSYAAGLDLAVKFAWCQRFQCILKRTKTADADDATLHIFREAESARSVGLTAGVVTSVGLGAKINFDQNDVKEWINRASGADGDAGKPFAAALDNSGDQLRKYVDEAADYTSKFLAPDPDGATDLAILLATSDRKTSCFQYIFNVADGNFAKAWSTAISGDFVSILANYTGAVELAAGSGLDHYHQTQTSLTLDLFGFELFGDATAFYSNVTIQYAGGGHFQLATEQGRKSLTSSLQSNFSVNLFFAATADSIGSDTVTDLDISLHGVLTANHKQSAVDLFGLTLAAIGSGPGFSDATARLRAYAAANASGPFVLDIVFKEAGYRAITATQRVNGKIPSIQPEDAVNWRCYASASAYPLQLHPALTLLHQSGYDTEGFLSTYGGWTAYQAADPNDSVAPPDRRNLLNDLDFASAAVTARSVLGGEDVPTISAAQLLLYYRAGQELMNLCDDLYKAVQLRSSNEVSWALVEKDLRDFAQDFDTWFPAVTLVALAQRCGAPVSIQPTWGQSGASIIVTVG